MPSLPRLARKTRGRGAAEVVARPAPVAELSTSDLTWVNVVGPDLETANMLSERFGWHPLDVEDIVSKRQRPKVDDYEEDGYLFIVLHFPVYDKAISRLNAAELDVFIGPDYLVTIPNRELHAFAVRMPEEYDLGCAAHALGSFGQTKKFRSLTLGGCGDRQAGSHRG